MIDIKDQLKHSKMFEICDLSSWKSNDWVQGSYKQNYSICGWLNRLNNRPMIIVNNSQIVTEQLTNGVIVGQQIIREEILED